MQVNLDSPRGTLKVELCDEAGAVLAGFSAADCLPAAGDGVKPARLCAGETALPGLAGKPIRVRFELSQGSLYGIQFA